MNGPGAANGTSILGTAIGGRYRLEQEIGHGGMSTVYKAFDTVLQRPVAIKLMHEALAADAAQLERFRREARAVAQLSHPNIVTVIDFSEGEPAEGGTGCAYIVFEYVEGQTLKALIRQAGRLEVTDALAYALELARALAAAHEHMVVHRDVKPQNVLLGPEGSAKITDFGIARPLTEQGLTIDGRVLGTTDYVSPEQALGQAVTVQSDVYSLGIVLYEMLIGEAPFHGQSPIALAMCHVRQQVPDVQLARPELASGTAAIVERATSKDLAGRYPSMHEMIADIEEALAIEASRAGRAGGQATSVLQTLPAGARRRLPWRLSHPLPWLASLLAIAVAAAIAIVFALRNAQRGTGVPPDVVSKPGLRPVSLAQGSAHDYNPFGTDEEDPEQVGDIVDGDPATTWSTQHYYEDSLNKPGTGVYVDASPGIVAKAVEVQTPTPGFEIAVYASDRFTGPEPYGQSTPLTQRGWTRLSAPVIARRQTKIAVHSHGRAYRYYLFWIEKLPSKSEYAQIGEVTLFR